MEERLKAKRDITESEIKSIHLQNSQIHGNLQDLSQSSKKTAKSLRTTFVPNLFAVFMQNLFPEGLANRTNR